MQLTYQSTLSLTKFIELFTPDATTVLNLDFYKILYFTTGMYGLVFCSVFLQNK